MESEKFITAKNLQNNIDKFKTRKINLEEALKCSSVSALLNYTEGRYARKAEIYLYDQEGLKSLISKEIISIDIAITELEKEFKDL